MHMKRLNNKMKRIKKKLDYKFCEYLSRGAFAQFIMLFAAIIFIIIIFGILLSTFVDDESMDIGIWQSLMHIIDQGTITGDETSDTGYIALMFIVTALGMVFTSTLIGIINNALREKLDDLKKGMSEIVEIGHLVILGFNDNIYCMLRQQIISNENYEGNRSIVVVDKHSSEDMQRKIEEKIFSGKQKRHENALAGKKKKSKLIYRTGSLVSENTFELTALKKAKAVIINKEDDFEVIQIILALTTYLKKKGIYMTENMPNIVALIHNKENLTASKIAAGVYQREKENVLLESISNRIQILYFEDVLAHIFAQVCRQPGLFKVFSEIFDYTDSEIYVERKSQNISLDDMGFTGKTFREINSMLASSIALGIRKSTGEIFLNPIPDMKFEEEDSLIHLAIDDNEIKLASGGALFQDKVFGHLGTGLRKKKQQYHILIFGWNIPLPEIIGNINEFALEGSDIKIISERLHMELDIIPNCTNFEIFYEDIDPYDWRRVEKLLNREFRAKEITNILLLCQDHLDKADADRKNAVLLLNIRAYLREHALEEFVNITSEMNQVDNQELLQDVGNNDFIVGSEITSRIMVQIANDPDMYRVFHILLNTGGAGINLRQIADYVDITKPFSFRYLCDITMNRADGEQEIPIGWIKYDSQKCKEEVRLNPKGRPQRLWFEAGEFCGRDKLIVLSQD